MCIHNRFLTAFFLAFVSSAAVAAPFTFDARSLAMGGANTANATLANAPWANPSMLTRQPLEDDFALLIGVGAFVRDDDDLIGDVKDFQDADDRRLDAIDDGDFDGELQAGLDMNEIINGLEDKVIAPEASLLLAFGIAFESFSMAVSARSDLIAGGAMTDLSCDFINEPLGSCDLGDTFSEDFNILNVEGVQATEFAVSFAKDFELDGRRVSVGIKPKIVDFRAFTFKESILTISDQGSDLLTEENFQDLGRTVSMDLGFAYDLTDSVLLGLNIRNIIARGFDLGGETLNYDPEWQIGIAYNNSWMTLAMDYDLTTNTPLLASDVYTALNRQDLKVGAEFRAGPYVALRLGAAKNFADDIPDGAQQVRYSAGVGFWLGFNLDVAVIVNDSTVGGMLQTGFSF